jgi:diaminobutyrate-2-oxoglutarate transaminase
MFTYANILEYESNVRYYSKHFPGVFSHAKGSFIYNKQNKAYLDFFSGAGALNYGHNNSVFKTALIRYINNAGIVHGLDMSTPAHLKFLQNFHDIILKKRNLDYKIQFTGPTGANAVEAALKLARKFTSRKNICYFKDSYHGLSLGALSVSDSPKRKENIHITFPHTLIAPYDIPGSTELVLIQLREMIETLTPEELPAAFILETVQGEGGVNVASEAWLKGVSDIARQFGILLIVDDIQVGCGRTGYFFSFEPYPIYPDIVCLSKSISGYGLPLAVLLLRPSVDVWESGEHNGTFRSNNLALLTAQIALNFWKNDRLQGAILEKAAILHENLAYLVDQYPYHKSCVKGRGLIQGIEWADDSIASLVAQAAFQEGLIIETSGKRNQVLKILPALTISQSNLIKGIHIIDRCMKKIMG